MDKNSFLQRTKLLGLERIAHAIIDASQPCIRIHSEKNDGILSGPGGSKLGGDPDVPGDFIWPGWKDRKLAFLAQINLAELAGMVQHPLLPGTGLLSFFYDPDQSTWGFDPEDQGSWKTYYFPDPSVLTRQEAPQLNSSYGIDKYNPCKMTFEPALSYPSPASDDMQENDLTQDEWEKYFDLYEETILPFPQHQIFGHANIIQHPMEIECQMVTQGIYLGDTGWLNLPNLESLQAGYQNWKLLLQLDSDDKAGWMWGDAGRLFFWIREEHLIQKDFSQTWMMLQCY